MCQINVNSEKYEYIYLNEDMNCNANMISSTQIAKAPSVGKDSSVAQELLENHKIAPLKPKIKV